MNEGTTPELSRPLDLAGVSGSKRAQELRARPEERKALSERFGLPAIEALTAGMLVWREADDLIAVEGSLAAEVVQSCVVTGDSFAATVTGEFRRRYLVGRAARDKEVEIDPESEDPPEPLEGGALDLGELVSEELALALDPYPRKPGVAPVDLSFGAPEEESDEEDSPFAALAALKGRKTS